MEEGRNRDLKLTLKRTDQRVEGGGGEVGGGRGGLNDTKEKSSTNQMVVGLSSTEVLP